MKLDDNPQMVAMLDHTKGSIENKIRQAYNNGYNDGFKAGVFEAWDDMRKQLGKSLRQQFEQRSCDTCKNRDVEGWKNPCLGCTGFAFYEPKDEPRHDAEEVAKDINRRVDMVKKEWSARHMDEPQTEPLPKAINGVRIADAVAWADKWLEDNPVSEMWDMIRTLRDATEWQNEPQTERSE